MKSFKFLPVAALFCCYVFGNGGAIAAQPATVTTCAVGGACSTAPMPASSYSDARSVDLTPRAPTPESMAIAIAPLLPTAPGGYCGWGTMVDMSVPVPDGGDSGTFHQNPIPQYVFKSIPCQGYSTIPLEILNSAVYLPNPSGHIYYDASQYQIIDIAAAGCPAGYQNLVLGGAFTCIKT